MICHAFDNCMQYNLLNMAMASMLSLPFSTDETQADAPVQDIQRSTLLNVCSSTLHLQEHERAGTAVESFSNSMDAEVLQKRMVAVIAILFTAVAVQLLSCPVHV